MAESEYQRGEPSTAIRRWQERLLPLIIAALALMAVFFFATTFFQLQQLNANVVFQPDPMFASTMATIDARAAQLPPAAAADLLRWKTLAVLEHDTIQHRYAQVNATLMLRAWTRHLGFVTGMMLAFVGAIFVLAKLSESATQLGGKSAGIEGTLSTRSPGVILAVLGTTLMLVTITINFSFTTSDVPVYLTVVAIPATPAGSGAAEIPPPELGDAPEIKGGPDDADADTSHIAPPLLATP